MVGRSSLRRLKAETAALHARAEQYVRILDADATVADYHRYLVAMHGYHAPLERALGAHAELAAAGFDAPLRGKRALIERDLAWLGDRRTVWPECPRLPALGSLARATGVAYVLEGSTLGGRYVLARLPPALAALRGHATAFLEGYGDATGVRWRAFGDVVARALGSRAEEADEDAAVDGRPAEDAAVDGACETFARLIDWLALHERPLPRPDVVTARRELAARREAP